MVLDPNYKNKLERFISLVTDIQNEVEAGTLLDENNVKKYEQKLGMAFDKAYTTAEKLYVCAINGRKEDLSPYFTDISAIILGFYKQPFREFLEKKGITVKSLEDLTNQNQTKSLTNTSTNYNPDNYKNSCSENGFTNNNSANNNTAYSKPNNQLKIMRNIDSICLSGQETKSKENLEKKPYETKIGDGTKKTVQNNNAKEDMKIKITHDIDFF